jgi:3-hydroxymyristoyl/3-hydroxydecanoyl-(acyl carrier protein) dehydratase
VTSRRIEIPADSRYFAGHFPGHPILPGIAHLALARESLPAGIVEVRTLRLRKPVGPGDVLDLSLDLSSEDGTARFALRRGGELVSQGTVGLGSVGAGLVPAREGASPAPASDLASLVPHAPPALLVRQILETSAEGAACLVEIPAGSPFAADGLAPAFVGLEAAAQTAAVLEALERRGAPGPRLGYLVGIRDARFALPDLPVAHPLRAAVRLTGSAPPLSVYEATVELDGSPVVTGAISTYIAGS